MAARAFGRPDPAGQLATSESARRDDAQRRIDDARQRLKSTIPPPEE
jgi:hypothetical protein